MNFKKMTYPKRNLKPFGLAFFLFLFTAGSPLPAKAFGSDRKAAFKEASSSGRGHKSSAKSGSEKSTARSFSDARRRVEGPRRLDLRHDSAKNDSKDKSKSGREPQLNSRVAVKWAIKNNSTLQKHQRAAELLQVRRLEEKRRAEAARQAAIERQHAAEEAMRDNVKSMIANDDTSGEDAEVRRVALNALGSHAGTVVVMDPKTGRIYSIVNQEWALSEGFKPCSTIKLVTGLAGLNEKVIDPTDTRNISDTNQVDLTKALAYSKNEYFQQVGGQVGFDKMISYSRRLGLGEKTGINLPHEFQGQMPVLKSGFALNRMSSHGDDFRVTALQLATLVSAIANGGKLLTPQVARTPQEETKFKIKVRRSVNIERDVWQYMIPGMVGSVNYGSGARAHDPGMTVVGKTGTCIESGGLWVGLFTSFAPLANPRLAVVVIARGPDGQNHFPAAVAGRIYRDLNGRFGTSEAQQVASARESLEDSTGNSTRKSMRATYATNSRLETEIALHGEQEGDEASPEATVVLPSRQGSSPNGRVKLALLPIPKRPAKQTQYAAVMSASSVDSSPTSTADGQSRPRRVLTTQR
jgi:membrane peptidoglycan carboxypeptidase